MCYSTEALKYAQSSYFVAVVMVQWSNIFACKCRKSSLIYSVYNKHMMWGILLETLIALGLCYTPGVQLIFGGRPLYYHYNIKKEYLLLWNDWITFLNVSSDLGRNQKVFD